jgi:hypothetical protein
MFIFNARQGDPGLPLPLARRPHINNLEFVLAVLDLMNGHLWRIHDGKWAPMRRW